LDIAIAGKDSNKAIAFIEIEEKTDRPKTLIGDVFGVLLGDAVRFEGKRNIVVFENTALIVIGICKISHNHKIKYLIDEMMKIKAHLTTEFRW
jgi:hypothetical protein